MSTENHRKNRFSNEFIEKIHRSGLLYNSVLCLERGADPYQIIEQLVDIIECQKKEIEHIHEYGLYPIIIKIDKEQFKQLKISK